MSNIKPDFAIAKACFNSSCTSLELPFQSFNSLGDLKEKYNVTEMSTAEGNVVIFVNEIEVSFLLNTSQISREWWNEIKMEELKNDLPIKLIII